MMRTEEAVSVDQTLYYICWADFRYIMGTILCRLNGE